MWKSIRGYEGLYEINENAVVRRMDGVGSDGRKVSAHVVVASRAQNGMRYIALWKDGKRRTYMLHKIYAAAFYISEKDAARRLYRGFTGDRQAVRNVKESLLEDLAFYKEEEEQGICHHDEILYLCQFLEQLQNDKV